MSKLYIVVPAYNEEANIECLVAEWHDVAVLVSPRSRLLVVDDGSTDNTSAILERLQRTHAQLRRLKKSNGGHGKAIYAGYIEALRDEADYVFQIDADRQTSRKDFLKFWRSRKHFEASIGFRANRLDGAERKFVSKVLQILLFLIYGLRIPDSNTPFRLIRSDEIGRAHV